jgi:uncharacterized RmlC-like cupin family protein
MTLVYAPPGSGTPSQKGPASNDVDYSTQSSTGTTTTVEDSSGAGLNITAQGGVGSNSITGAFTASTTTTDSSAETIVRTQNGDVKVFGQEDGVDHSFDLFRILLNPAIFTATAGNSVSWNMGWHSIPQIGATTGLYPLDVAVYELKNNAALMRPQIKPYFSALKFTKADYDAILAQDPFAYQSKTIDPARFVLTTFTDIPYEAQPQSSNCTSGNCLCTVSGGYLTNEWDQQTVLSSKNAYKVSLTGCVGVGSAVPVDAKLCAGSNITWSNTSTTSHLHKDSETASYSVACPSATYMGQPNYSVYWDTLYGAFLFVPEGIPPNHVIISQGSVTSYGIPVRHLEVDLTVGTTVYHTLTHNNGEYTFISDVIKSSAKHPLTAVLSVGGVHQTVTLGSAANPEINLTNPVTPLTR